MLDGECVVWRSENTSPPFAHTERHDFVMASFTEPTICDVCRKLLRLVVLHYYLLQVSKSDIYIRRQSHENVSMAPGGREQVRLQCLLEGALRPVR